VESPARKKAGGFANCAIVLGSGVAATKLVSDVSDAKNAVPEENRILT
jgi:hypothetical protein